MLLRLRSIRLEPEAVEGLTISTLREKNWVRGNSDHPVREQGILLDLAKSQIVNSSTLIKR
jgi:hypothetical protein